MGSISSPITDAELQSPSSSSSEPHILLSKLGVAPHGNALHMLGSSSSNRGNAFLGELSVVATSPEELSAGSTAQPGGMASMRSTSDKQQPHKALPCPRCNSLDTKFCYYNNYNVNQPRHFCKNCQRYWTAGGTLRNVAVGAGRRKRKHSSSEPKSPSGTGGDTPSKKAARRKPSSPDGFAGQKSTKPHPLQCLFASSDLPLHDQKSNLNYGGLLGSTPLLDRDFFNDEGLTLERIGSNMGISCSAEGVEASREFNLGALYRGDGSEVDRLISIGLVSESSTPVMNGGECGRSPRSESSCGRQQSAESACTSTITISQGVAREGGRVDELCREVDQGGDMTPSSSCIVNSSIDTRVLGSSGSACFPPLVLGGFRSLSAQEQPIPFTWQPPLPIVHVPSPSSRDADPERRLWAPKTLRINDLDHAAWSSVWSSLGLKGAAPADKACIIPETRSQCADNPSVFSHPLAFQERS